jgi:hypothetical protein
VAEPGANTRPLVGRHRRADAAAADQHAALSLTAEERLAEGFGIVRIVHGFRAMRADIHDLMAELAYIGA